MLSADAIFGAIVTIGLAAIAGVVWLVRLEGRINTETQVRESQLKAAGEQTKALLERQNGFEERIYTILERIESKLDGKADR